MIRNADKFMNSKFIKTPFIAACILGIAVLVLLVWLQWPHPAPEQNGSGIKTNQPIQGNPLFPPEMNAAEFAKSRYVIGDLGGMKVRIPSYFANYVEYEGDPTWGEKRQGPVPVRDFTSKFKSFGFDVRFPDMAGRSTVELWKDQRLRIDAKWEHYYYPEKSPTHWIDVGILSGKSYPGDGFLTRGTKSSLSFDAKAKGYYPALGFKQYEKLPQLQHGLTVYSPPGIDPQTNKPFREDSSARDLYIFRNVNDEVLSHIECTNHIRYSHRQSCRHDISMEPKMHAQVYITYSRAALPHWREIQAKVSELILSFETPTNVVPSTK
jgi:hypothetical protein